MVKSGESLSPETDDALCDFIRAYTKRNHFAPSLQDMGDFLGVKRETVKGRLDRLARAKRVSWMANKPRTVRVLR